MKNHGAYADAAPNRLFGTACPVAPSRIAHNLNTDQLGSEWPQGWMTLRPAEKDEEAAKQGLFVVTHDGFSLQSMRFGPTINRGGVQNIRKRNCPSVCYRKRRQRFYSTTSVPIPTWSILRSSKMAPMILAGSSGFQNQIRLSKQVGIASTIRHVRLPRQGYAHHVDVRCASTPLFCTGSSHFRKGERQLTVEVITDRGRYLLESSHNRIGKPRRTARDRPWKPVDTSLEGYTTVVKESAIARRCRLVQYLTDTDPMTRLSSASNVDPRQRPTSRSFQHLDRHLADHATVAAPAHRGKS